MSHARCLHFVLCHASKLLQENNTHTPTLLIIRKVLFVNTAGHGRGAIVEEVIMQLSVTSAELELLKEERVVVDSESVEHIEVSLHTMLVFHSTGLGFLGELTFLARISASLIRDRSRSLRTLSSSLKAASVA